MPLAALARSTAVLALGVSLLGLPGLSQAQRTTARTTTPVAGPVVSTPEPAPPPPAQTTIAIPYCDSTAMAPFLHIPTGNNGTLKECLSTLQELCFVGVDSLTGIKFLCTNHFVDPQTPDTSPPSTPAP